MTTSIDFAAVLARVDLRSIVEADIGFPAGRKWRCPFHADSHPSLGITPDGQRYKCFSCKATGTALDWVMQRSNLTIIEAAKRLRGYDDDPPRGLRPIPPPRPEPAPKRYGWQDPAWQVAAEAIVARAEANLRDAVGREVRAWLADRGLASDVIGRFRLGYLPEPGQHGGIRFERGVSIPWVHPEGWYSTFDGVPEFRWVGANVRRLMPDVWEPWTDGDKCRALAGSSRGYPYPDFDVAAGVEAIVLEGEFDALLAHQELGHVINTITVGGAQQTPRPEALAALAGCPAWLIATDHDPAGDEAARRFAALAPAKAHRAFLPHGNDLTEFVTAGGDALGWLRSEFVRLGWDWPLRATPP